MNITIVGGGTAGWLSALYLASKRPQHQYTVIDSASIGPIGVGEAATGKFNDMLEDCGINIMEFIKETDALPKHALRFVNWGKTPGSFDSPLEYSVTANDKIDQRLFLQVLNGRPIEYASVSSLYSKQEKTSYQLVNGQLVKTHRHALQFDASKTASVLKRHAMTRGVKHINETITEVILDDTGIKKLKTLEGNEHTADLFIDCSGLSRLLITHLSPKINDATPYIHVNSAMLFRLPNDTRPNRTLGVSISRDNGWNFEISTRNRIGSGYVHNSNMVSQDTLLDELSQAYGQTVEPVRTIHWTPGSLDQVWIKNCIAIGLSASFLEPLQTGAIHDTISQLGYLIEVGLQNTVEETLDPVVVESYNRLCKRLFDDYLDFLSVSYASKKDDTDFWKFVTYDQQLTDRTKFLLEVNERRLLRNLDFTSFFGYGGPGLWNYTLAGIGLVRSETVKSAFESLNINVDKLTREQEIFEQEQQKIISQCLTSEELNSILKQ
jgi:tryptophan halogenase